jgi:hypothetical protein
LALADFFSGLSTTASVASTFQSLLKNTRGTQRAVLLELQKNINLLNLFINDEAKTEAIIKKLDVREYEKAVKSDFNFKDLKKTRVSGRLVKDVKFLEPYIGWQTEKLFENIYLKIHQLKTIIDVDPSNVNFRLGVRLKNLHKIMILLLKHIKY